MACWLTCMVVYWHPSHVRNSLAHVRPGAVQQLAVQQPTAIFFPTQSQPCAIRGPAPKRKTPQLVVNLQRSDGCPSFALEQKQARSPSPVTLASFFLYQRSCRRRLALLRAALSQSGRLDGDGEVQRHPALDCTPVRFLFFFHPSSPSSVVRSQRDLERLAAPMVVGGKKVAALPRVPSLVRALP